MQNGVGWGWCHDHKGAKVPFISIASLQNRKKMVFWEHKILHNLSDKILSRKFYRASCELDRSLREGKGRDTVEVNNEELMPLERSRYLNKDIS